MFHGEKQKALYRCSLGNKKVFRGEQQKVLGHKEVLHREQQKVLGHKDVFHREKQKVLELKGMFHGEKQKALGVHWETKRYSRVTKRRFWVR